MAAVTTSNTFDFNGTSYYYKLTGDTGSHTGRFLASGYAAYATYWGYTAEAVYNKNVSSIIISVSADTYTISGSKTITFYAACAPLKSITDGSQNTITSGFGATTSAVTLPKSGSVSLDITNVIKYAAENYNKNWGLYLIGGGDVDYASKVTFNIPTFTAADISEGLVKIHNGSTWVDGVPYVHNGSAWVKAKAVYVHDGSSWVQV